MWSTLVGSYFVLAFSFQFLLCRNLARLFKKGKKIQKKLDLHSHLFSIKCHLNKHSAYQTFLLQTNNEVIALGSLEICHKIHYIK